jgi:hypothetical protein
MTTFWKAKAVLGVTTDLKQVITLASDDYSRINSGGSNAGTRIRRRSTKLYVIESATHNANDG